MQCNWFAFEKYIFSTKEKKIERVDCKCIVLSRPDDKIMMLENLIGIQTSTKKN
jgi:hypothetical protein